MLFVYSAIVSVRLHTGYSHGTGWDTVSHWLAQLLFLQLQTLGSSSHRELLDHSAAGPDACRGVWVSTSLGAGCPLCPLTHHTVFRHQARAVKVWETPVGALTISTHTHTHKPLQWEKCKDSSSPSIFLRITKTSI